MTANIRLDVVKGPLAGRSFEVPPGGLRLGRLAACGISIPSDPSISRNHCLFEIRGGTVFAADLNSANGTLLNGEPLSEAPLRPGDTITAGETELLAVAAGADEPAAADAVAAPAAIAAPAGPGGGKLSVDLGFGRQDAPATGPGDAPAPGRRTNIAIAAALLLLAAAAALILFAPPQTESAGEGGRPVGGGAGARGAARAAEAAGPFESLSYEHVDAGPDGVSRSLFEISGGGALHLKIDEVPDANRHVDKRKQAESHYLKDIAERLEKGDLTWLPQEKLGPDRPGGAVESYRLRWKCGSAVHDIYYENSRRPPELETFCRELENFAHDEFRGWPLQYSSKQLVEMAGEERRNGDAKWTDRNADPGNAYTAMKHYDTALAYLEFVSPKPGWHAALEASRKEAEAEVDRRWERLKAKANIAENARNFEQAGDALEEMMRTVHDTGDPRHKEASDRLFSVQRKAKGKGLSK